MNLINQIMSYDKNQECNCENCESIKEQITEYPPLTEEEIEQIIKERYFDKDEKTKIFIRKSLKVHNDKYDYSNVIYVGAKEKVEITCRVEGHKSFLQTPTNHLSGKGCSKCKFEKLINLCKSTTEEFIKKANKIHGEGTYDYSKVNYINANKEVIIICLKHGEFIQTPNHHLQGQGCPSCYGNKKLTTEKFIEKSNEIHGEGTYDYSKVNYVNTSTEVIIICPKHTEFTQTPRNHLQGHGCPICRYIKSTRKQTLTTEEFIEKSNKVHGKGTYDYSKVNYINSYTDVIIICQKHGEFAQKPHDHLNGRGCSKCNNNQGEMIVRNFLIKYEIEFEEQKTFEGCKYKQPLKFDFYLPQYNLCIESDGSPHFQKINWNGKYTDEEMEKELRLNQLRDQIKNNYCKENKIGLLRLNNIKTFEEKLTEYFQNHEIIK